MGEINESANGTLKSVFIKRKPKQPIKGKKKKRFLNKNKNKNKITKRQSTPNFHAAKSSKSTPMKQRNLKKKKKNVKRRSRPKLNNASSEGTNTKSKEMHAGIPSPLMKSKMNSNKPAPHHAMAQSA